MGFREEDASGGGAAACLLWLSAYLFIRSASRLGSRDEPPDARAITRFGELCRFLTAKKIIRPKISNARIARRIKRAGCISPNGEAPAGLGAAGWAGGGC